MLGLYWESWKRKWNLLCYIGVILGIMEKKMESTMLYWGYIGIMEKKMESTMLCWGYIGNNGKKMESAVVCWGYIGIIIFAKPSAGALPLIFIPPQHTSATQVPRPSNTRILPI